MGSAYWDGRGREPGPARRLHPRAPRSALNQPPPRSPGRERAGEASAPGTEAAPSPAGCRRNEGSRAVGDILLRRKEPGTAGRSWLLRHARGGPDAAAGRR